jgi:outer membrane protein assembly factor BamB/predicted MPP superfamily phosphohydrolase
MRDVRGRIIDSATGRGLHGVAVCNGEAIVSTNEDGSFVVAIQPDVHRFIFVTVPAGFRAGADFFRATCDLDPDRSEVTFECTPHASSRSDRFICAHLSDFHLSQMGESSTAPDILRHDLTDLVQDGSPDLVIASGDLTEWGTPGQLSAVADAAGVLPCPWFPLFGGHDGCDERYGGRTSGEIVEMKRLGKREELRNLPAEQSNETWTHNFEAEFGPCYYSFDWGRWHFVMFPNEGYHDDRDQAMKEQWLWADLERQSAGRPIAVVVHSQPHPPDVLDRLEQAGVRLVLHGHWHSSKVIRRGGLTVAAAPPLCFGGIDTSPRGYYRIAFNGDAFQIERRVLYATRGRTARPAVAGVRWHCQLPGQVHRAAPVRCGDRILASIQNPTHPDRSGVVCVDDRTGEVAWRLETENDVANRVAVDASGDLGVVATTPGKIYAFEIASGALAWAAELPGYPFRWLYPAPVIVGETVIAGGKAGYGAWDLHTGASTWYRSLIWADKWPSYAGAAEWESLLILPVAEGLEAVDSCSGEQVWRRPIKVDYPYASPVVAGDRIVNGGDWVDLFGTGEEPAGLVVLDAATGKEIWHRMILEAAYPAGMAVHGEIIFVSTPHGEVQAYHIETSELLWRYSTGQSLFDVTPYRRAGPSLLADPVVIGNDVIISGCDGVLAVMDARTGNVRHRLPLGAAVTAPVCALNDGFCAATFDGRLFAFDLL